MKALEAIGFAHLGIIWKDEAKDHHRKQKGFLEPMKRFVVPSDEI